MGLGEIRHIFSVTFLFIIYDLELKGGREACVIREAFYMEKTEAHVASLLVTSLYDLWVTEGRVELGAMACTN